MAFYEQSIDMIIESGEYTFRFEPLFEYIILFLSSFTHQADVILKIVAGATTLIFLWSCLRFKKASILFAAFIFPYFYLDMTMNGIRYGLAFAIILLASSFLIEGKRKWFYLLAIAACAIQVSSAVLAIMLFTLVEKRWKALAAALFFIIMLFLFMGDYIAAKLEDVAALSTSSVFSGLAPLLLSVTTLIALWVDPRIRRHSAIQLILLMGTTLLFYALTQFTYGGLRFQLMNLYLIYVFSMCVLAKYSIEIKKTTLILILLIGLMAVFFRLKNFSSDHGTGDAPFSPYHFSWER